MQGVRDVQPARAVHDAGAEQLLHGGGVGAGGRHAAARARLRGRAAGRRQAQVRGQDLSGKYALI